MKPTTPIATYQQAQAEARALVDRLSQALAAHAETGLANPNNWGYTGDLYLLNSKLLEALAAVGGLTDAERVKHRI